ncbi:MAG: hypothetical protein JWM59_4043 [Verrucomicrobiales bacterium]|nr:hypothetical protein [Verrucomicrobiales bacterium]
MPQRPAAKSSSGCGAENGEITAENLGEGGKTYRLILYYELALTPEEQSVPSKSSQAEYRTSDVYANQLTFLIL